VEDLVAGGGDGILPLWESLMPRHDSGYYCHGLQLFMGGVLVQFNPIVHSNYMFVQMVLVHRLSTIL
jgi:hypothetical protein